MKRKDDSHSVKARNNGSSKEKDTDGFIGNEAMINDANNLSVSF